MRVGTVQPVEAQVTRSCHHQPWAGSCFSALRPSRRVGAGRWHQPDGDGAPPLPLHPRCVPSSSSRFSPHRPGSKTSVPTLQTRKQRPGAGPRGQGPESASEGPPSADTVLSPRGQVAFPRHPLPRTCSRDQRPPRPVACHGSTVEWAGGPAARPLCGAVLLTPLHPKAASPLLRTTLVPREHPPA